MPLFPPQDYRKTLYTHRRGLAAARPAAADVLPGTLYFSTDTGATERSNGTSWESYSGVGSGSIINNYIVPPIFDGIDGEDGFGLPGPQGSSGIPGSNGTNGTNGINGIDGLDGEPGLDSFIPGPQGLQGIAGSAGINGTNGIDGSDGTDGLDSFIPGPQGLQGIQGVAGTNGINGINGINGVDGEDGLDSLVPGPAGANGAQGIQGIAGIQGTPGPPGLDAEEPEIPYIIPGPQGIQGIPGGGGGGGSATTIEVNLSAIATWRGRFTITDASITATSKVLVWQAPGPYTGKGTRADEAELQPVNVIMTTSATGSAQVTWETPPIYTRYMEPISQFLQTGATNIVSNPKDPQSYSRGYAKRIGKVRGNVKFSYMILS